MLHGPVRAADVAATLITTNAPLPLEAVLKEDRLSVTVEGRPFTEYVWAADAKFPYFEPLNGPRSGRSLTVRGAELYPHHSSLWFGCDRVNGGNYWQEGLERGRIVSKRFNLVKAAGDEVRFEQECDWERPGAPSPFHDRRRVALRAPSRDRRILDFDITLTAKLKVRIEKNNHSLFAVRMAPELAVKGGGQMANAAGARGEAATFGQASPWMDARGRHDDVTEGLALFDHPSNRWYPTRWFTRDYGFLSPTPLNWIEAPLEFAEGETVRLRYRVLVHADAPSAEVLQAAFEAWSRP